MQTKLHFFICRLQLVITKRLKVNVHIECTVHFRKNNNNTKKVRVKIEWEKMTRTKVKNESLRENKIAKKSFFSEKQKINNRHMKNNKRMLHKAYEMWMWNMDTEWVELDPQRKAVKEREAVSNRKNMHSKARKCKWHNNGLGWYHKNMCMMECYTISLLLGQ